VRSASRSARCTRSLRWPADMCGQSFATSAIDSRSDVRRRAFACPTLRASGIGHRRHLGAPTPQDLGRDVAGEFVEGRESYAEFGSVKTFVRYLGEDVFRAWSVRIGERLVSIDRLRVVRISHLPPHGRAGGCRRRPQPETAPRTLVLRWLRGYGRGEHPKRDSQSTRRGLSLTRVAEHPQIMTTRGPR
jgi:hypothetical protein